MRWRGGGGGGGRPCGDEMANPIGDPETTPLSRPLKGERRALEGERRAWKEYWRASIPLKKKPLFAVSIVCMHSKVYHEFISIMKYSVCKWINCVFFQHCRELDNFLRRVEVSTLYRRYKYYICLQYLFYTYIVKFITSWINFNNEIFSLRMHNLRDFSSSSWTRSLLTESWNLHIIYYIDSNITDLKIEILHCRDLVRIRDQVRPLLTERWSLHTT